MNANKDEINYHYLALDDSVSELNKNRNLL